MIAKYVSLAVSVICAVGVGISAGEDAKAPVAATAPTTQRIPPTSFMGVADRGMRVVLLCDSSGSMMTKFDTLRAEMRKSIDQLLPVQSFNVIFFAEDKFLAPNPRALLATPANKRKAIEFIEKTAPHGSTDPIPGLRAAFADQPQVIYLLTDGDFPNNAQLLDEIRVLNKDKKVKIDTIAFMDRGDEYEKLLKTIADENGGKFKFVGETDLDK